jgi:hypoxia up-regulated 1
MYGIDRMDTEKDLHVLYYNMGSADTEVSVVRYSSVSDAKNKTYEYVEVMGEGYDATLGGREFDHVLVGLLADEFNGMKERQGKADIRENGRAMRRLYKESGKIKDVLSANRITDVKVGDLADYTTLQFKLSRE